MFAGFVLTPLFNKENIKTKVSVLLQCARPAHDLATYTCYAGIEC